uniref:hypothetical protein n=1 Tax=Microbulbifer agarilyticus TaxID=260552 RepID=UPI0002E68106|nr:hypothetical protein [Microbulbifer agarilyticus]
MFKHISLWRNSAPPVTLFIALFGSQAEAAVDCSAMADYSLDAVTTGEHAWHNGAPWVELNSPE